MDPNSIIEILTATGYTVHGMDGGAIVIDDPSCITGAVRNFINIATTIILAFGAMLIFGWGFAMIRGSKLDMFENTKNLAMLMLGLGIVPAVMQFLLNSDMLECRRMSISLSSINDSFGLTLLEQEMMMSQAVGPVERYPQFGSHNIFTGLMARNIRRTMVIDARATLSEEDIITFQQVASNFAFRERGCDSMGCGHTGASRIYRTMPQHEGTDFLKPPGAPVPSMFDGVVLWHGIGHRNFRAITIYHPHNGTTAHYLYVTNNNLNVGDTVMAGQIIAHMQDFNIDAAYRNIPNHLHFELWNGRGRRSGNLINIEGLL